MSKSLLYLEIIFVPLDRGRDSRFTVLPIPRPLEILRMQCTLGTEGVSEVHTYGQLSPFEQSLVDDNVPALIKMATKGSDFVKNN